MINSKILAQTLMKLSQSQDSEKTVARFFKYIEKQNLCGLLPQVKKYIEQKKEEFSSKNTVVISTKHDLSESDIRDIISITGAEKDAIVKIIKDTNIVGGFSVLYQGNIYDGSLRNHITQLRNRLTH